MDQNLPNNQSSNPVSSGLDQTNVLDMGSTPVAASSPVDLNNSGSDMNNVAQAAAQVGNNTQSASDLLAGLARGEVIDDVRVPFIIQGSKVNNKVLRLYILKLRTDHGWSDSKIIDALIVLDEMVEKGILDPTLLTNTNDNN